MATIISIGSGKGGVGKSIVSSNIAYSLAAKNYNVILIDLDAGGADAHIMFGHFHPKKTLSDFLLHRVDTLEDTCLCMPEFKNLKLIPGMGETLFTANLPTGSRRRLINHIKQLDADFIIIDVGAGTHITTLDYFMMADYNICLATTDPTSVLDLYRFVKLAVVRKSLSVFLARDEITKLLNKMDINSVDELIEHAKKIAPERLDDILDVIKSFNPLLVFNQVSKKRSTSQFQLKKMLFEYVGVRNLPVLGEIQTDVEVVNSVKAYQPVMVYAPKSRASYDLAKITNHLIDIIEADAKT